MRTASPEAAANTLLCLINQASYLLHRQIARLEQDFLAHGGFTERLYGARKRTLSEKSDKPDPSDSSDPPYKTKPPACPLCAKPMRLRTARQGARAGTQFWGFSAYPECKGTRPAAD